mgnify:CR=1 FL=1
MEEWKGKLWTKCILIVCGHWRAMIAAVLVCDSRGLIHVGMKWGVVMVCIAYWEADINNWKETGWSVLGLKKSDERMFSWTAILTATYSKSHHCNKKVMIFGIIRYRSPKFYTEKIWLFPVFLFYFSFLKYSSSVTVTYSELCHLFCCALYPMWSKCNSMSLSL